MPRRLFLPLASSRWELFYGKKHLNSFGSGNTFFDSGEIASFEEMMSDPGGGPLLLENVQGPGLWCEPVSSGGLDPEPGVYEQCFCASAR